MRPAGPLNITSGISELTVNGRSAMKAPEMIQAMFLMPRSRRRLNLIQSSIVQVLYVFVLSHDLSQKSALYHRASRQPNSGGKPCFVIGFNFALPQTRNGTCGFRMT